MSTFETASRPPTPTAGAVAATSRAAGMDRLIGASGALEWLLARMAEWPDDEALATQGGSVTYREMARHVDAWGERLPDLVGREPSVVAVRSDYSPSTCALLLALWRADKVVVPLASSAPAEQRAFLDIAEVQTMLECTTNDEWRAEQRSHVVQNPLLRDFFATGSRPGLVLFSSGSTGQPKGILHDVSRLLEKFVARRRKLRTLTFLLLDHIGGVNTLLYVLSNGGTVVNSVSRNPADVCRAIEQHQVELLPVSPTFLNLLLISGEVERHDLGSLKLITYGTEMMPETLLTRVREVFPHVHLQQTYGMSELGILRSQSPDAASRWMRIGGEGFDIKVVDGTLRIKAQSAMVGYLNAPSPFDAEGWFDTGDEVEERDGMVRILGRRSDVINVGGQKVFPAEVESVLLQMDEVAQATVYGEANPLVGRVVAARITPRSEIDTVELRRRVRAFCQERLPSFKVPAKIVLADRPQHNYRFKKAPPR